MSVDEVSTDHDVSESSCKSYADEDSVKLTPSLQQLISRQDRVENLLEQVLTHITNNKKDKKENNEMPQKEENEKKKKKSF